jgi:radical SAM superfamily enzyme YgiQ (UPF0313 family)
MSPARKMVLVNANRMRPPVVPLALEYLHHALTQSNIQADVLDLCFADDPFEDIDSYFSRNEVFAVAITFRNTDDTCMASREFLVPRLKEVTDRIRQATDAPLVVGGAGFSIMPEAILEYCDLDLGIWGEGEKVLPLLADRLCQSQELADLPGLIFRQGRLLVRNPSQYFELSHISPKREILDNRRYYTEGAMGAIETKRGCPMGCVYCADPLSKGDRVRLRSPRSVADEFESLLNQGVEHVHICDSEFNIPSQHAAAVCRELVGRGLGDRLRWYTYASPVPFTDEDALLWQKAGCVGVNFGVDSLVDPILKSLGRRFTSRDIEDTAAVCRRNGLVFMYDLLLGGPGETRYTLKQTIDLLKKISPDRVGANLGIRILPGTPLALRLQRQGPLDQNRNVLGATQGNDMLLDPVFYLSSALGSDPEQYLMGLIGGDDRFFLMSQGDVDQDYNYNENTVLVNAIEDGQRGAFWDILRRVNPQVRNLGLDRE